MKTVMISIKPKWVAKIASGEKTIEVRKTRPKIDTPFKCYIYETKCYDTLFGKGNPKKLWISGGKVIGEFVCDRILESFLNNNDGWFIEKGCLTQDEIDKYQGDKAILYGWHISDLVIYDEPKELSEFAQSCNYKGLCFSCKRASFDNVGNVECKNKLTRPPQSWCYVEEKE